MTTSNPKSELAQFYIHAGERLNRFFSEWTGAACCDCLGFHLRESPHDPIAGHELAGGVFPGCCQAGVADDLNIPDGSGKRLPDGLVQEIFKGREFVGPNQDCDYLVRELSTGRVHRGRGCKWLGSNGCALGALKSPICLSYICPPLRARLSRISGDAAWEKDDDLLGFFSLLHVLYDCAVAPAPDTTKAKEAFTRFLRLVDEKDMALQNGWHVD